MSKNNILDVEHYNVQNAALSVIFNKKIIMDDREDYIAVDLEDAENNKFKETCINVLKANNVNIENEEQIKKFFSDEKNIDANLEDLFYKLYTYIC